VPICDHPAEVCGYGFIDVTHRCAPSSRTRWAR
jgi:hypothetical protein